MKITDRMKSLEREGGLSDDLPYMLYLKDGWELEDGSTSVPVANKREAMHFLKSAQRKFSNKNRKIVKADAFSTGGGNYTIHGQLDDGTYFIGDDYDGGAYVYVNANPMRKGRNDDFVGYYPDWVRKHIVKYGTDGDKEFSARVAKFMLYGDENHPLSNSDRFYYRDDMWEWSDLSYAQEQRMKKNEKHPKLSYKMPKQSKLTKMSRGI